MGEGLILNIDVAIARMGNLPLSLSLFRPKVMRVWILHHGSKPWYRKGKTRESCNCWLVRRAFKEKIESWKWRARAWRSQPKKGQSKKKKMERERDWEFAPAGSWGQTRLPLPGCRAMAALVLKLKEWRHCLSGLFELHLFISFYPPSCPHFDFDFGQLAFLLWPLVRHWIPHFQSLGS